MTVGRGFYAVKLVDCSIKCDRKYSSRIELAHWVFGNWDLFLVPLNAPLWAKRHCDQKTAERCPVSGILYVDGRKDPMTPLSGHR